MTEAASCWEVPKVSPSVTCVCFFCFVFPHSLCRAPWLWYRVLRAAGGRQTATVRSPRKSGLAPGSSESRIAFAAFTWSSPLCASAYNYQRHMPMLSVWSVNAAVSKCLSTTVSFLQLLESVFPMLKAKRTCEATLPFILFPVGYSFRAHCAHF